MIIELVGLTAVVLFRKIIGGGIISGAVSILYGAYLLLKALRLLRGGDIDA